MIRSLVDWAVNPEHLWILLFSPFIAGGIAAVAAMVKEYYFPPRH